jgi:hypothetical protein
VAGQVVGFYVNPYSLNGGQRIPIKLHPFLPAGTIFAWCQNLPAYYQSSQVPMVAEIQCRRDWYQIPWPIVTRSNATGVYRAGVEVLLHSGAGCHHEHRQRLVSRQSEAPADQAGAGLSGYTSLSLFAVCQLRYPALREGRELFRSRWYAAC